MAEIPVERKSGMPWWVWLVLAALAIALLIWIFADDDREAYETAAVAPVAVAPVSTDPVGTVDPVDNTAAATATGTPPPGAQAGTTGPITDLAALTAGGDMSAMVGRQVNLTAVPVTQMAGDRTFFVGEGSNRLFVILPEGRPGMPTEDSINVNQGQRVTVSGTIQPAQGSMSGAKIEGLPADAQAVLVAESIQIASR